MQTPCPHCGALNRPAAKFCQVCGLSLAALIPSTPSAPPTATMPAAGGSRLVANNGQVFALSLSNVTIGREASDVLIAADARISRQHARLEQTASGWQIADLDSRNGTYVNGMKMIAHQPCPLQPGDQIVVGDTTLIFDPPVGLVSPPTQLYSSPSPMPQPADRQVQWQAWPEPPQVEGRVMYIEATPHQEQKSIWGKVAVGTAIAVVAPRLAFLPFLTPNQVAVRDLRIEDRQTGRQVAVRIKGDLIGSINTGDDVAVWARPLKGGVLEMIRAHNYTTGQDAQVK